MQVEFSLPVKPFSVNAMYYGTRRIKTKECRAWELEVMTLLADVKDLQDLKDTWEEMDGVFHVELRFYYPWKLFYNSNGRASSKVFDVTNVEKLTVDAVFRTMGIDDKYLFSMHSSKHPAESHRIDILLELKANNKAG